MIKCKFVCTSVTKKQGWNKERPVLYDAKLIPVSGGSEENKLFWEASPAGSFELSTVREMPLEVGKEYYIELKEAETTNEPAA